jgi:hypothetical protein
LAGFTLSVSAQSNRISWDYNYKHFGIDNGLPSSETYQVYQDRSGLLWILTDRGIVRYDGFRFKTYTVENGLSDNVNFRIHEDPNGNVWFIGYNGLLSVYEDGEMKPYRFNSILQKRFFTGHNIFASIYVTKDGSVVYGTNREEIVSINKKGKVTVLLKKLIDTIHFFEFENQIVFSNYSMTNKPTTAFFHRNGKRFFWGKIYFNGTVRLKKHQGYYFIMCGRSLFLNYDRKFKLFPDTHEVISLDSDGEFLYVGYYKNGMKKYRFDKTRKQLVLVQHYLSEHSVSSVCKDRNGGLWITTLEKGVFMISDEAFTQLSYTGKPVKEDIRFINGNKSKVIITYYVGKWQQLYPPYLLKDYGKTLLWSNLIPYRDRFAFQKNQLDWSDWPEVDDSYEFKPHYASGSSIVGIRLDSYKVDEVRDSSREVFDLHTLHKFKIPGPYLRFYLVPHKKIFFVLNEGVFAFDIRSSLKSSYKNILKGRISQLKYHKDWGLIAFSNVQGLFKIDIEHEKAREFAPDLNLGKQILTVFFDEQNRLWIASGKGIHLLTKKNGKISAKLLSRDLLSSREINDMYSYENLLYLATKSGVQKIDFLNVKKEMSANPINILSVRAFTKNKLLNVAEIYPAKTDLIRIALGNIDLNRRNVYRYRFRKDQTWTKSDKGEITLSDPADGKYNLEVAYLNLNNEWSKPKQLFSFEVEKIIFLRWYFILLYVVLIVILFYIILKLSIQSVNKKNYMLNRMMELERMALAAQMNPHFIFNSLNSIHSFLLYEENENAEKYLVRFAKLIRQTLANSRVSYITIEEEYDTLKNYILLESMRFKQVFSFRIDCDYRQLPSSPCIPPMLIQPYVENAILHGLVKRTSGGELYLKFYVEDEALKVMIRDNGVGYSESRKKKRDSNHKSYGTQITEERLKSLQGKNKQAFTVSMSSVDDSNQEFPGTCVIVSIPLPG